MALDAVSGYSVRMNYPQKTNLRPAQSFTSKPEVDEEKSNATKYMIGATALAAVIGLGIAGHAGKLGKGIQELLGGAEKATEKGVKRTEELVTNAQGGAKKTLSGGSSSSIGMYGQDLYDPIDPMNAMDPMSPYYRNPANDGLFGQNLYDPVNPMNTMDPLSPSYQDPMADSFGGGFGI